MRLFLILISMFGRKFLLIWTAVMLVLILSMLHMSR